MNKGGAYQFYQLGLVVKRYRTMLYLSQEHVSKQLGYKSGQFISNVERGICGVPFNKLGKLSKVIRAPIDELINAMVEDYVINIKDSIEEGYESYKKAETYTHFTSKMININDSKLSYLS